MRTGVGKNHAGLKAPRPQYLVPPYPGDFRRALYSSHAAYACSTTAAKSANQADGKGGRSNPESIHPLSNCDQYNGRPVGEENTRGFRLRYLRVTGAKSPSAIEIWSDELQQKFRSRGQAGIVESWQNLKDQKLDLPIIGSNAHSIWSTLVVNLKLWDEIFAYAVELRNTKGEIYDNLYRLILGRILRTGGRGALRWHERFRKEYVIPSYGLRDLIPDAISTPDALRAFRLIYIRSHKTSDGIYDTLITALLEQQWYEEARRWNRMLIKHDDKPSKAWKTWPVPKHLGKNPEVAWTQSVVNDVLSISSDNPILKPSNPTGGRYRGPETSALPFDRADMSVALGKHLGVGPKEMSDEFCARIFATKAFSLDTIIKGLSLIATTRIGPLAFREMAVRAGSAEEILKKVETLRSAGIGLTACTFSKAVVKLATLKRKELLNDLLLSDQHPEVLEDAELQTKILSKYIDSGDWQSAHRTLALLTLFHKQPRAKAWNLLLRHYARRRDFSNVLRTSCDMMDGKIWINSNTLNIIWTTCIPKRRRGHRSPTQSDDTINALDFVTDLWIRILNSGAFIHPTRWREILKRYGMEGRFNDLRSICLKLVERYSSRPSTVELSTLAQLKSQTKNLITTTPPVGLLSGQKNAFREIFRPALQQAIVIWGFRKGFQRITEFYRSTVPENAKSGLKLDDCRYFNSILKDNRNSDNTDKHMQPVFFPNSPVPYFAYFKPPQPHQSFLCGLLLVEELAKRGVSVQVDLIRKVVKDRLWQLYSLNKSKVRANQAAFVANLYKLEDMVWAIEQAWNGPTLFPELYKGHNNEEDETMMPPKITKVKASRLSPQAYVAKQRYERYRRFFARKGKGDDFNAIWAIPGPDEYSSTAQFMELFPPQDIDNASTQSSENKLPPSGIVSRLPPPLLQGLVDFPRSSDLSPLTTEERIEKRKALHFTIFGTQPMALGRNRRRRVNKEAWAKWVDRWARKYEYPGESSMHQNGEAKDRPKADS